MGERDAVGPKSGLSVSQSDPGLTTPTLPPTAGRKPAARPPVHSHGFDVGVGVAPESREAGLSYQPKTGRGAGQNPAEELQREALDADRTSDPRAAGTLDARSADSLSDDDIQQFIEFFKILDRWDREAHGHETM
jgi:hypothetical protein